MCVVNNTEQKNAYRVSPYMDTLQSGIEAQIGKTSFLRKVMCLSADVGCYKAEPFMKNSHRREDVNFLPTAQLCNNLRQGIET